MDHVDADKPSVAGAFVGSLVGIGVLVGLDTVTASMRPPGGIGFGGASLFVLFGVAFGLLTFGAIAAIDAAIARRLATRSPSTLALVGAIEGTALFAIAVLAQDPRTISGNHRIGLLLCCALGMAVARTVAAALPVRFWQRAHTWVCLAAAATGLVVAWRFRYNGQEWSRVACDLATTVALARLVAWRLDAGRARRAAKPLAIAAAVIVLASGWLLGNDGARTLLHQRSAHVRSWIRSAQVLADGDGDGATNLFGGLDCDADNPWVHPRASEIAGNGVDDNCRGGDPPVTDPETHVAPAVANAPGHDVLILSIDALRADAVDQLTELADAVGPHVVFTRAQSPAPATKESLSATMRGVPVRALAFERHPDVRGSLLWRDDRPSLGHVLRDAGYRTVTVPSNNMFEPRIGVTSGFDSVWLANNDALGIDIERPPQTQDHVSAHELFGVGLRVAERTPGPLCLWLHLMDTHSPYHHPDGTSGPRSRAGYDRAVAEVSTAAAAFVREFIALRGRAPVIVVLGDHGEEFGEHGGVQHASSAYFEQVAVTLLVGAPGLAAQRITVPVVTNSIPRTVLDLVGVAAPTTMTEPSLLGTPRPSRLAVSESTTSGGLHAVGYTRGTTRLVVDPIHGTAALFDLKNDPTEQHDIAAEEPALAAEMLALALQWNESH